MAVTQIEFIEASSINSHIKYAIIVARYKNLWVFVKPKKCGLWCLPSGKIELGEDPLEACKRELYEETKASAETIQLLSYYSVTLRGKTGYGIIAMCDVKEIHFGKNSEICHVALFSSLPKQLRFSKVQKALFFKVHHRLKKMSKRKHDIKK